ncbi:MAG: type II toxin-antitoxin system VapC family toxin [Chloroflexota bacterium]|nr:type II toxin-antitoxin system VapC family toxin [Chloroflexota bacterium]
MAKPPRVFDSWALIAFLEDEPAAERIEAIIADAHETEIDLLVTAVNLGEVWYSLARVRSEADAEKGIEQVLGLGFQVVDADWSLAERAARLKAKHAIAYADCFAAALAEWHKAEVITGDPEFKKLQGMVKVHWVQ